MESRQFASVRQGDTSPGKKGNYFSMAGSLFSALLLWRKRKGWNRGYLPQFFLLSASPYLFTWVMIKGELKSESGQ